MNVREARQKGLQPSSDPYPWAPTKGNLEAVWDWANSSSYSGSGNLSSLVASPASGAAQGDYTFTPGNSTGGSLPGFAGTAGRKSRAEYGIKNTYSYFKQNTPTTFWRNQATTAMDFTFLTLVFMVTPVNNCPLVILGSDSGGVASGSMFLQIDNRAGSRNMSVDGANTTQRNTAASAANTIPQTGFHAFAASCKANASSFLWCDGAYVAGSPFTFTMVGATAGPSNPMSMWTQGSANASASYHETPGNRYLLTALWNRALTKAELDFAYVNLRSMGRIA